MLHKKTTLGGRAADIGLEAELNREAKLGLLVSAGSARLAADAAKELCRLAATTLYLGRELGPLAGNFQEISRRLEMMEQQRESIRSSTGSAFAAVGGGGRGRGGGYNMMIESGVNTGAGRGTGGDSGRTKEFDAYTEMLDTMQRGPMDGEAWTGEEIDRLRRMRDVVECAAARVVGEAVAHEALSTVWRGEGLIAAE